MVLGMNYNMYSDNAQSNLSKKKDKKYKKVD